MHASEDTKRVFLDKPRVTYRANRRPRNLRDELVRAKVKRENDIEKGVRSVESLGDSLMRAVRSKENVHTSSTFPLIVIHLEWLYLYYI